MEEISEFLYLGSNVINDPARSMRSCRDNF